MKKFNKSKVIIPALAMIALTTAASATGTVAWFAANSTVTAEALKVNVKSGSSFLLIAKDSESHASASDIQGLKHTSVQEEDTVFSLLPSAHETFAKSNDVEATKDGDENTYKNWFTAASDSPTSSKMNEGTKANIAKSAFASYVKKFTYHFTVALGTKDVTNLKVSKLTISATDGTLNDDNGLSPVKALVVGKDQEGFEEFDYVDGGKVGEKTLFTGPLTDQTTTSVSVYLYYNGADTSLYTHNMANLEGATVAVEFSCTQTA